MKTGNLYLTGLMGAGKSTLGAMLAKNLNCPFYDVDKLIEKKTGKNIDQIFAQDGEKVFRRLEKETLISLSKKKNAVIALGGGSILGNHKVLKETGTTVYLKAYATTLDKRTSCKSRPLLKNNKLQTLRNLLRDRKKHYEMADHTLRVDHLDKKTAKKKILEMIESEL